MAVVGIDVAALLLFVLAGWVGRSWHSLLRQIQPASGIHLLQGRHRTLESYVVVTQYPSLQVVGKIHVTEGQTICIYRKIHYSSEIWSYTARFVNVLRKLIAILIRNKYNSIVGSVVKYQGLFKLVYGKYHISCYLR